MKHKLFAALFALSIAISGLAGFSVNANAANTSDVDYSFQNVNYDGYTLSRLKEDYTKVYVYPHSGPELKYTVQGSLYGSAGWVNRSATHKIYSGTKASITNYVKENGEGYARLHYERVSYSYAFTNGVWSPDSAGIYNVYT